jgi:hypothetical protein
MADFMQKLWCSTQPRNRNFALMGSKEGIMHISLAFFE